MEKVEGKEMRDTLTISETLLNPFVDAYYFSISDFYVIVFASLIFISIYLFII